MSHHRSIFLVATLLSLMIASVCANPAREDTIVLSIDGETWTAAQFKQLLANTPPQVRAAAISNPKEFADRFVEMRMLAQLAESQHLENDPDIRQRLAWVREGVLSNAARDDLYQGAKVSDEEVERYYDEHRNEFTDYTLQHIVIRYQGSSIPLRKGKKDLSEDEARTEAETLRNQIERGEDFSSIAVAHSDDASSLAEGGVLPETSSRDLLPEIASSIVNLKQGEVSAPIRTSYGYHLVRIINRSANSLADATPRVKFLLKERSASQQIDAMHKSHQVTFNAAFFGAAKPSR